jgi:predicted ribosome quality control (RQC) complex YloA/Tae2 family protein
MDQFLLQGVVSEAAVRLVEQEVLRVSCLGRHRYLLRFATRRKDNLLLSVRPDLPRFHLVAARRAAEEPPDRFGAWLDHELTGAILLSVEKRPWDRVVFMRFRLPRREDGALERRLVVELLGRSANLIALDPEGLVLAHGRDMASRFRAPEPGKPYEPPRGREEFDAVPLGPEAVPIARERLGGALSFLSRVSPLIARDLTSAGADDEMAEKRLVEILEAARRASWSPVVYSSRPLQEMAEGDDPGTAGLIVAPLPLLSPRLGTGVPGGGDALPVATPFAGCSEAAEAGFGLVERLRDFRDLRDHHEAIVRKETEKLSTLLGKLETELAGARGSDRFRRLGEALLAGLTKARVERDRAIVPDPYASEGEPLSVPIDPALPLQENARLLFERYKKGKRGAVTIEKRLNAARARLAEWRSLAAPAAAVRDAADLERLREAMARLGLVHAARPARRERPPRLGETPARVRRYTSPDGLLVLVGKSGEENDRLTFKIASPWDFWLHAAGRPGAHVVVRNPKRLKALPEKSLRLAAEVAAYHSGARQEGKVEVHYTQRKHVHKRKGMPSGQVLLRRFRSLQVTPRLPTSTLEEI